MREDLQEIPIALQTYWVNIWKRMENMEKSGLPEYISEHKTNHIGFRLCTSQRRLGSIVLRLFISKQWLLPRYFHLLCQRSAHKMSK